MALISTVRQTTLEMARVLRRRLTQPPWHQLRQTEPLSNDFGFERGTPIGRYYIEKFLTEQSYLIRGTVLEVAENSYTKQFGRDVQTSDVLHYTQDNSEATMVGDLTDPATLPPSTYDCFICTQTLNMIYDVHAAIKGARHVLKSGGHCLVTVAGQIHLSAYDHDRWGDYWRFTTQSAERAFADVFGKSNVDVRSYGNVLTCTAMLHGLCQEDLTREELDHPSAEYQQIIAVVARKK